MRAQTPLRYRRETALPEMSPSKSNGLSMTREIYVARFIGLIFLLSAIGKLAAISADTTIHGADPLFAPLLARHVLLGVALLEAAIGGWFISDRKRLAWKWATAAWLSSCFLLYRFGLWMIDYSGPCGCFGGTFQKFMGLSERFVSLFTLIVAIVLLSVSMMALISHVRRGFPQNRLTNVTNLLV